MSSAAMNASSTRILLTPSYHAQESTISRTRAFSLSNSARYFKPPSLKTRAVQKKSTEPNQRGVVNSQ
jgi:hypothetical protein